MGGFVEIFSLLLSREKLYITICGVLLFASNSHAQTAHCKVQNCLLLYSQEALRKYFYGEKLKNEPTTSVKKKIQICLNYTARHLTATYTFSIFQSVKILPADNCGNYTVFHLIMGRVVIIISIKNRETFERHKVQTSGPG